MNIEHTYEVKSTQLNINLIDRDNKDNKIQVRVILEDELYDTEDGCEFNIYPVP